MMDIVHQLAARYHHSLDECMALAVYGDSDLVDGMRRQRHMWPWWAPFRVSLTVREEFDRTLFPNDTASF